MNKYIELISNIEMRSIVNNLETTELNYKFNVNDTEECQKEINKLIYFFWHTYINSDCIRLYFLNDELLYFEEKMLRYIKTLLEYIEKERFIDELQLLSYYLISLNYSYCHGRNYTVNENNPAYLKLFYSVFERSEFYNGGSIITRATEFAREVISYAVKDKENILNLNDLLLDCCRICSSGDCPEFQLLHRQFITIFWVKIMKDERFFSDISIFRNEQIAKYTEDEQGSKLLEREKQKYTMMVNELRAA